MERRDFLKNTVFTTVGLMILPSFRKGENSQLLSDARLDEFFLHPAGTSRPWCFWMWMNGNVTKEGITLDLEAMHRMGIGGFINFNTGVGIPRGPVDYASDQWMELTAHAAKEARRLGLEMNLHNSPGYSGCGGPWVTPDLSMQQLVWTETRVETSGDMDISLPRPFAKKNYYADAFVLAYPSLACETALMKDTLAKLFLNGKEADKTIITDGDPETKLRLEPVSGIAESDQEASARQGIMVFQFSKPFEARAITLTRLAERPPDLFDGPRDNPPVLRLEYSNDGTHYTYIGSIHPPELREMNTPAMLGFPAVKAIYYRLVSDKATWISDVELHNGPRLAGWPGKTNWTHGDASGETPALPTAELIDPDKVLDISGKMDASGNLRWQAPAGKWTVLRIGHTTTGEENAAHPDSGKGLEIDKFRKEAIDFHFEKFLNKVIEKIRSAGAMGDHKSGGFTGFTVDSWEAGKQNWTADFPGIFAGKTGYQIVRWMPALTGRVVKSTDATERFLWDVRKVQSELLADNFYGHYAEACHKRGLGFAAEPYGDGNFDSLRIGQYLDVPMSEFWTRYIYGSDLCSEQAVSIAHAWGRPVVAAESYTAMPATAKWTDYPYSLKAEGDYFFSLGINRLVFHAFVHQPYTTGFPGMTYGPFGMHIDRNNTWTEQAYAWINYIKRCQSVLQLGLPVVDVCYFQGDEPVSGVENVYTWLPAGYRGDVVGADALHKRFAINNGVITLPDGIRYRLCVMAPLQAIRRKSLERIAELVGEGMVLIVNAKPEKSLGLTDEDAVIRQLSDKLFGNLDGKTIQEHRYGKGKVIWGKSAEDVLKELSIEPDFTYTARNTGAAIHYGHRHMQDADVYFISNHKRREEEIIASFRLTGLIPEVWDAETGEQYEAPVFHATKNRTELPLTLSPAGSFFVVFRKGGMPAWQQLLQNGKPVLQADKPFTDFEIKDNTPKNTFSIMLWAKPDTFAHSGRSMLFHAPEGEVLFGKGNAAVGLGAGQNGVRVYECSKGAAREVLFAAQKLEGWTHIALVYTNGTPSVYINGELAATGKASFFTIRPVLDIPASEEQYSSYFEGNYTPPELIDGTFSTAVLNGRLKAGLPAPELPFNAQLKNSRGNTTLLAWKDGDYLLQGQKGTRKAVIEGCRQKDLSADWQVHFPKESGVASLLNMDELASLHLSENVNIRCFSGTCTYKKTFTTEGAGSMQRQRFFLDLGRVEVIAEVKVNGKDAGLVWKEPYIIDITGYVTKGSNELEVAITNLWPNRLIGDEALPSENSYSSDGNIEQLPDWYVQNKSKPGERLTFTTWHVYDKDGPLLASGLLGPVHLLTAIEKQIITV